MSTTNFLSDQEQANILDAISDAESQTSGEIRLHLELRCKGDVLDRAAVVFETLAMHKTALRNGVLFYLATEDRKFAILGDGGINAVVPEGFWNEVKDTVIAGLAARNPAEGLASGIRMAGQQLSNHFPVKDNDINELSNDISFGS
ncbi:MAG: TPM domain-containing protein [Flavobacteriales bacterium]